MILLATLAAMTLSPVVRNDDVVAFTVTATVAGQERQVFVTKQHAVALTDAIAQGGGQQLIVRRDNGRFVMVDSKDDGLRAAIIQANDAKKAADRLADPLGFAYGDLQWAELLLRAARADEISRPDVPADWVANHEKHVDGIKTRIVALGGEI